MTTTHQVWIAIMVLVCMAGASQSARAATRTWDNGSSDNTWANPVNWSADTKPGAGDTAQFNLNTTYTVTNDSAETVGAVLVNSTVDNAPSWLGSGTLNVVSNFSLMGKTTAQLYFKPTLTVNGMLYTSPTYQDSRSKLKFGDAGGYTGSNSFLGGIYSYSYDLDIGGATTFGSNSTLLVQGGAANGTLESGGSGHYTKISGTPAFGTNMTFDLRRGGTLWFPAATDFSNVSTLSFKGGRLQLDAASGYTFPTYANGFEVKRGILTIPGNGSLGGTDANGITLGSTGGFGYLEGGAANSAGNYITRPITLSGNGGFVDVWKYFLDSDMNFATPITGSGLLVKTGDKTLYLRNVGSGTTSSYSGGSVIANGIVSPESARTLGTGNVSIPKGGQLDFTNAANVSAGAKVWLGGDIYHRGVLHMIADVGFPAIDTNSTGSIALEVDNTHTIASIGSAFLGASNNMAKYSGTSLPAGPDHVYRIGGTLGPKGDGTGNNQMLILDVNGANNGAGVLTGNCDVVVAYGGCKLNDINTFTGSLTVRRNVRSDSLSVTHCQPEFQTGGSPLGDTNGPVNLYGGELNFDNTNAGVAIAKGALNIQGQNYLRSAAAGMCRMSASLR